MPFFQKRAFPGMKSDVICPLFSAEWLAVPEWASHSRLFLPPFAFFLVLCLPRLEAEHDVAELNPVAVLQFAAARHRVVVDAGLLDRGIVVDKNKSVLAPLDNGVAFLDVHVAEQSDVSPFVAAQQRVRFQDRVLSPFLPAAEHADRRRLEDALHQGRKRPDRAPEENQAKGRTPDVAGAFGPDQLEDAVADAARDAAQAATDEREPQLVQRPGREAFAEADGQSQKQPAQAAEQDFAADAQCRRSA